MAKAYKCDLCGKFSDNCYRASGIDIYPADLIKIGIDKRTKVEISDLCEGCHKGIMDTVIEIFRKSQSATTE